MNGILREMDYDPNWWQLAYDLDGQLVGFVMPAKAPAFSTIAYFGVLPEQRGRGYIDQILRHLHSAGCRGIHDSCGYRCS